MGYQCGDCKAPLDEKMLDSGVCPACGARISPFGDVIHSAPHAPSAEQGGVWESDIPLVAPRTYQDDPPTLADAHRLPITKLDRLSIARATPLGLRPPDHTAPDRATTMSLIVGVSIAAIMVLVCTLTVVLTTLNNFNAPATANSKTTFLHRTPQPTHDPNNLGFATQGADPTPLPYNYATPTLEATTTPFGGPPTATPAATVTPGTSPTLSIAFSQQPSPGKCLLNGGFSMILTITFTPNAGLVWSITSDPGYKYTSTSGTGTMTITVSHITHSGTVTVSASGTQNGSASATIVCSLA